MTQRQYLCVLAPFLAFVLGFMELVIGANACATQRARYGLLMEYSIPEKHIRDPHVV